MSAGFWICFLFLFFIHISLLPAQNVVNRISCFFSEKLNLLIWYLPSHCIFFLCFMYENDFFRLGSCWICENWFSFSSSFSISIAHAVEQFTRMLSASSHHTQRVQWIHSVQKHPSSSTHDHTRCLSNNCSQESNNKSHGLRPLQTLGWWR